MVRRTTAAGFTAAMAATAVTFGSIATAAGIEEVVVTATKRAESELDLPMSIEAITGEQLATDAMRSLDDLSSRVPNVTFGNGLTQAAISIRGMGSGPDRSFEQSVAMFVDDIYMPRSRQYRAPLFDIERVEILRGPQALLFGLNATAGSVNITTASTRPGAQRTLQLSAGYEAEYAGYEASLIAGSSLGERLGARLALSYVDTGDGYYFNEFTGEDESSSQEIVARGTLVWDATEALTFTGKLFYANADEDGNFGETYGLQSATLGDGKLDFVRNADARYLRIVTDQEPGFDHDILNGSMRFDYESGGYTLTGIGAYSQSDYDYFVEIGNMPEGFSSQAAGLYEKFDQTSVELHLTSPQERTVSYLVGAYAAQNEVDNVQPNAFGDVFIAAFPPGITAIRGDSLQVLQTSTYSAFASLTWNITDRFRLTGGARYSHEEKENERETPVCQSFSGSADTGYTLVQDLPLVPPFIGFCGTLPGYRDSKTSDNLMPELLAQWDFADRSMAYAKIGKSAKSGGYAFSRSVTADSISYDDEIAKSAEIGVKSRLMDGRATFGAAVYYTRFEDLQLTSFEWTGTAILVAIRNAGESVSKGIEVDFNFAASDWLTVGTSVAYLDSKYEEFVNGPCFIGEPGRDPVSGSCNKSGDRTPNAPELSGTVFADVSYPLGNNLMLTAGMVAAYSDEQFTEGTLNPNAIQRSYTRWDARVGVAAPDRSWELSLIGKNLSDEAINSLTQPIATLAFEGYPGLPRTVTLRGTVRF
jgi:outer membrane receptor protein involved in Fe transport